MIYARNYSDPPHLGVRNEDKTIILTFMKSVDTDAICEGYVMDFKTGHVNKRYVDAEYESKGLGWYEEDTYNFEFNDMELSPEFCARVLELIGQD